MLDSSRGWRGELASRYGCNFFDDTVVDGLVPALETGEDGTHPTEDTARRARETRSTGARTDRAERAPRRCRPLNLLRVMPAKEGGSMLDESEASRRSDEDRIVVTPISVFEGTRPTHQGNLVTESHGMAPIPEDQRYGSKRP